MADPTPPVMEESIRIQATPSEVWEVVADLKRMGEWSPECVRMHIWGGEVGQGARFTGLNRRKLVVWPTNGRIHLYDAGRAIGWTVYESGARWTYHLEPDRTSGDEAAGTVVTERRELPRGKTALTRGFAIVIGGSEGHDVELRAGMRTTLERIKADCESAAG